MIKKNVIRALTIITIVLFTGCGSSKLFAQNTAYNKKTSDDAELKGEIKVWSFGNTTKAFQAAAANFQKKYPKCKITIEDFKSAQDEYAAFDNAMHSQNAADIITVNDDAIPYMEDKYGKNFLDLTDEISASKDSFLKSKIAQCTYKEKIAAFPGKCVPEAMFYREDILKSYNINSDDIKTWDDYVEYGNTILKNSSDKVRMTALNVGSGTGFYMGLLDELDSFYFDGSGKVDLNSSESNKAMNLIKTLNVSGLLLNISSRDELLSAVKSGTVVSVPAGFDFGCDLMSKAPELKGKWSVKPLPCFEAGGNSGVCTTGEDFMVLDRLKSKKISLTFLKYAFSSRKSLMNSLENFGLFPSYVPCYDDKFFDKKEEYFSNQDLWQTLSKIAQDTYDVNYTKNFSKADKEVLDAQTGILFKNSGVSTSLDELQNQVEQIVKQ